MDTATPQLLYHRERNPLLIIQEGDLIPEKFWNGAENLAPIGIRSL
jgi:hypothetical protein